MPERAVLQWIVLTAVIGGPGMHDLLLLVDGKLLILVDGVYEICYCADVGGKGLFIARLWLNGRAYLFQRFRRINTS